MTPEVSPQVLDVLACPACRGSLRPDGQTLVCRDPGCAKVYPVREGIPVLLVDHCLPEAGAADA